MYPLLFTKQINRGCGWPTQLSSEMQKDIQEFLIATLELANSSIHILKYKFITEKKHL